VRIAIDPRFALLAPVLRMQVTRMIDRIEVELKNADADVQAGRSACFRKTSTPVDAAALQRAKSALGALVNTERQALAGTPSQFRRERVATRTCPAFARWT